MRRVVCGYAAAPRFPQWVHRSRRPMSITGVSPGSRRSYGEITTTRPQRLHVATTGRFELLRSSRLTDMSRTPIPGDDGPVGTRPTSSSIPKAPLNDGERPSPVEPPDSTCSTNSSCCLRWVSLCASRERSEAVRESPQPMHEGVNKKHVHGTVMGRRAKHYRCKRVERSIATI